MNIRAMEYRKRYTLTSELTSSAVITGMTVLLCYAHLIPFLGVIISMFSPLPLVLHGYKFRVRMNALVFTALIFIFAGSGLYAGLVFTLIAGVPALVIGNRIRAGDSAFKTILVSGFAGTIITGAVYFALTSVPVSGAERKPIMESMTVLVKKTETQVLAFMEHMFQKAKEVEIDILKSKKAGRIEIEAFEKKFEKDQQRNLTIMKAGFRNMLLIFPTAGILSCLISVFIYYLIAEKIIPRVERGAIVPQIDRFAEWVIPWQVVWILICGLLANRVNSYLGSGNITLSYIGANCLAIASFLLMIGGLSLIQFFLERGKARAFTRGVCYTIAFFFMHFVVSLGLLDLWFDYRKKYRLASGEENFDEDDENE